MINDKLILKMLTFLDALAPTRAVKRGTAVELCFRLRLSTYWSARRKSIAAREALVSRRRDLVKVYIDSLYFFSTFRINSL